MDRTRTIKPAATGKKRRAAFAVWSRLNEQEMAVLDRCAKEAKKSLKEYLTDIAVRAIERKARAETTN